MADTKVVTRGGHAQWKVDSFRRHALAKTSDPFRIGIWNWYLTVERSGSVYVVRLFPEPSLVTEEPPPLVRFFLCVAVNDKNTSTVHEGLLRASDDFAFSFENVSTFHFTIDVDFWNLKISPVDGGKAISIWPCDDTAKPLATRSTPKYFSRMLNESILTDITINTADGTVLAHRAVLSASSPVFHSMFTHDLKEKQSSTVDIEDMTSESCMALLAYIYGTISEEEFWKQRLALVAAANKYNISDLKGACEESLLEDINLDNVFERLQKAKLYQLDKLKKGCVAYLLDFGKKYDVLEDLNGFFREADKELVVEMFQEVLAVWYKA